MQIGRIATIGRYSGYLAFATVAPRRQHWLKTTRNDRYRQRAEWSQRQNRMAVYPTLSLLPAAPRLATISPLVVCPSSTPA